MGMQLSQSMRPEMRQLLTPRMIQSMEILQLPLALLEERIEQELQNNPVLELDAANAEDGGRMEVVSQADGRDERSEGERPLMLSAEEDSRSAKEFERLEKISEFLENEEFFTNQSYQRASSSFDGERDKKLDAMTNTAARGMDLSESLLNQWAFIECSPAVKAAGQAIINYINSDGYLKTDLELIQKESKTPLALADLQEALVLIQTLEPTGIGARNLKECLLIQLDALEEDPEL